MLNKTRHSLAIILAGTFCTVGLTVAAQAADNDVAKNKAIVQGFWRDVLIAKNVDAAPRYLKPDYQQHNPHEPNGLIGFENFFRDVFQHTPPNFKLEIVKMVGEGDIVVTYNKFSGTGPDGKPFEGTGFDMFRIQDGLIAEHWDQVDPDEQAPAGAPPAAAPPPPAKR
ncbi:MAG TPA: ester cyclase [Aliidongia sp.]|nr:ester cyclase [Aliidongia sp.]